MTIALSGDRSLRELTEIRRQDRQSAARTLGGVGEVHLVGGLERAINVWIDADRLAAYQIPITAVRDAIERQNADIPGGNVTGGAHEEVLRTLGRYRRLPRVQRSRRRDGQRRADPHPRHRLAPRTAPRNSDRSRGSTACRRSSCEIRRQSGANTVAVIEAVKAESRPRCRPQLPSDVKLEVIRDQSRYIYAALHEINLHLILGSILACLVVFWPSCAAGARR